DEPAEANHARHFVKIAKRGFDLCQHVDRADTRRLLAILDRYPGAELAFRHRLAARVATDLARYEQQRPGAYERALVGDRGCRGGQNNPKLRKLFFNGSGHDVLPADMPSVHAFVFADRAYPCKPPRRPDRKRSLMSAVAGTKRRSYVAPQVLGAETER